jgi:putative hydrolase of the HAD superfamily
MVKYERGQATSEEFIQAISASVTHKVTSGQIIDAWNALLLDFPSKRVELLQQLRSDYRLFLLSNTNQIHFEKYTQQFQAIYGYPLESLFEKMWFSHQIGLSKPDTAVFEFVLKDKNLNPAETLFIDDTLMHVEAARKSGIYGWHLTQGSDVCEILK